MLRKDSNSLRGNALKDNSNLYSHELGDTYTHTASAQHTTAASATGTPCVNPQPLTMMMTMMNGNRKMSRGRRHRRQKTEAEADRVPNLEGVCIVAIDTDTHTWKGLLK